MTKNHLKEKDFCYINIENDLYYNLCYPTRVNLKKLKKHEIIEYVNTNYLYNENRVLNNLLKDLIIFKTYRDEIEKEIKNEGIAREIIIFFISVISAILSLKAINKEHLSNEQVNIVFFALIIYIFLKVAIEFIATSKNSDSSRLIVVNYAIYTLESIIENKYNNPNYSENKTDKTDSKEQVSSDNSDENDIKGQDSNIIFDPEKSFYENIEDARSEDIINFIENYEFHYNDINLENLNEDLLIFRFCKNDLDRDLKNREIFINYFGVCISVSALIVAIIAVQNKPVNPKLLEYITLGIVLAYLIVMIFGTLKIFNDDKGSGKLVALQYAIDTLEMKKEELESEKKD